MTGLAKNRVDSKLTDSQPDPDARPTTPEPATPSGVRPNHALFDHSPSEGTHSAEFRSRSRKRRSTERGESYITARNRAEDIREKSNWTRKRNNTLRTRITEPGNPNSESAKPPTSQSTCVPLPPKRHRGRSRDICNLSRSPTPGSTDHEVEPDESTQANSSQYTYIYETLPLEALHAHARKVLGEDFAEVETQVILERLRDAPRHKAAEMAPPRQSSSIVVLPGEPLQVGGGWHGENAESQSIASRGKKRASDETEISQGSSKRLCSAPTEDSATEPETDDEPLHTTAAGLVEACAAAVHQHPNLHLPSAPGTHPPAPSPVPEPMPPSRESTAATVLDTSTSFAQTCSIGADLAHLGECVSALPMLLNSIRDPIHARLCNNLTDRFPDHTEAAVKATEKAAAADAIMDMDEQAETEIEEVPETDCDMPRTSTHRQPPPPPVASTGLSTRNTALQRTYQKNRTHAPSQLYGAGSLRIQSPVESNSEDDKADEEGEDNEEGDDKPLPEPNSPRLTNAHLLRRERTRAFTAKLTAELQDHAAGHPRPRRLFAEATNPPLSQAQARPPPGPSGTAHGVRTRRTRRLDPVSAARHDMIKFNEARVQNRATSFVQSVTQQSQRTARCRAPTSRPRNELLPDDEEDLAQAEAFANNRWPDHLQPHPPRNRKRKPKPLARDLSGIIGQVTMVAKIHLFVYGLVQGIYQTRATFLRWAQAVHEATWEMELPMTPYVCANNDVFEIMVNNLATLRGRVKERVRAFVESNAGFKHSMSNQKIIQKNLQKLNLLYPNNFHCKLEQSYCPRRGHYENPELGRCIAVLLFHGPNSAGMMYPDYFINMPLTVVAFVLALWQFGLEEWLNGWHQNGDLGTASMREKYEAQLAGLKELRDVAPRRMEKLQQQWCKYIEEYSGASFKTTQEIAAEALSQRSEMRPDTPEPENAISVDEMNEIIFNTRCQESLREHTQEFLARHGAHADDAADPDTDPGDQSDDITISRSPTPPPEINQQGRFTSHSKGKGRAN